MPISSRFFLIGVALISVYFAKPLYDYTTLGISRIEEIFIKVESNDLAKIERGTLIDMTLQSASEIDEYIRKLRGSSTQRDVSSHLNFSSITSYDKSAKPYRLRLGKSIGYPPPFFNVVTENRVAETLIAEDRVAVYYKIKIPIMKDLFATGLYIRPKNISLVKPLPLIIAANGRSGPPDASKGKSIAVLEPNDRNIAYCAINKGFAIWLPTFVHYGPSGLGDRARLSVNSLTSGTSLPAIEIAGIVKAIDFFSKRNDIKAKSISMMGHSYGGFYTLYAAALDLRIKALVVSAYINSRETVLDNSRPEDYIDWRFNESLSLWRDPEVVALVAPRPLMIEAGIYDQLFPINGVRNTIPEVKLIYKRLHIENNFVYNEIPSRHDFSCKKATDFISRELKL